MREDLGYRSYAKQALAGEPPSRAAALALLRAPDEHLREILLAAFAVRKRHFGSRVKLCMLRNARSGMCAEDCHYCSQSVGSTAAIDSYRLQRTDELITGAREAAARGARRYCMAVSGRGPSASDIAHLAATVRAIKAEFPMLEICLSLGIMDEDQARALKSAGVGWVNHNLNTSERFYPSVCTTHAYADRIRTVLAVKRAGLSICCGGIVGMGESDDDIVDVAFALREIGVDSLPVNFLQPIDGTQLEGATSITPAKGLKALCLFRFSNPASDVRAAGGRERNLGPWQGLALYPASSIFIEGYLTTPGLAAEPTRRMVEALGFSVEHEEDVGAGRPATFGGYA